jgi:diguanylate cyclase (GGDEF)-like protein
MDSLNQPTAPVDDDITLAVYLDALETGDVDEIERIWARAERNPGLEQHLHQFHYELLSERTEEASRHRRCTLLLEDQQRLERLERLSQDLYPSRKPDATDLIEASYDRYRCSVLVVDDEAYMREALQRLLSDEFEVLLADSVPAARKIFGSRSVDIVLSDQKLPYESGMDLLEWVRENSPRTVSLLMTGYVDLEVAIDAFNSGRIFYYLRKPWYNNELLETLRHASRVFLYERKNRDLLEKLKELNLELEEKVKARTLELMEAVHELHQKNQMLEKLAMTDPLTGLPNRRAMNHLAERELLRRKRSPGSLAIALIDIDHFKQVNTTYRWMGGDRVLTEVCQCLSRSVREVDYLGRYGGEEFLLIAPLADVEGARTLGERIRGKVESMTISYRGAVIQVTVSLGFAVAEPDNVFVELDVIRDAAERALAEAKESGRNRVVVSVIPPSGVSGEW